MQFTDTHCHIHEDTYPDTVGALKRARKSGVSRFICVGTDVTSSKQAVNFAEKHDDTWASIGLHPHDAVLGPDAVSTLAELIKNEKSKDVHVRNIVAIGECGLDYFYDNSPRDTQITMLEAQLQLASDHHLPVIFHVRNAFDDFWPIFRGFQGLRGVLHSYTDDMSNLEVALSHDLCIGVNGISTFTKDPKQQQMYASIPVNQLLFETDSPFLTPIPHRGMVNEPAFVTLVAQHIANLQSIDLEELSRATEQNATTLFFNTNT